MRDQMRILLYLWGFFAYLGSSFFFFFLDRVVEASGLFSIDFFFYLSVFPMHRSFLNAFPIFSSSF